MIRYLFFLILLPLLTACGWNEETVSFSKVYPDGKSEVDLIIDSSFTIDQINLGSENGQDLIATLLSYPLQDSSSSKAVLYIHGFGDYFFQLHLASFYHRLGFNFYALDLRRSGRSLKNNMRNNYTADLTEYFQEIDSAVARIKLNNKHLVINAHSQGGLIASLYANEKGVEDVVDAYVLNSPFFDLKTNFILSIAELYYNVIGKFNPTHPLPIGPEGLYTKSLHKDYYGEWEFNTTWKPIEGVPLYAGWVRAVRKGHQLVENGLQIEKPILVLHSDRTIQTATFEPEVLESEIVLEVNDIKRGATKLGSQVTIVEIPGAIHDVVLSKESVRNQAFSEIENWLDHLPFLQ
jgi:alpha-beta hydrolase superfamily lysophospholipase